MVEARNVLKVLFDTRLCQICVKSETGYDTGGMYRNYTRRFDSLSNLGAFQYVSGFFEIVSCHRQI